MILLFAMSIMSRAYIIFLALFVNYFTIIILLYILDYIIYVAMKNLVEMKFVTDKNYP